jgi:hypothetical protein
MMWVLVALLCLMAVGLMTARALDGARWIKRAFEALAAEAGAQPSGWKAKGERDGIEFVLELGFQHRWPTRREPFLRIAIPGKYRERFRLLPVRESATETVAELVTGDTDFDRGVRIEGESLGFAAGYFGDPARRRSVLRLFRLGAAEIVLQRKSLAAVWVPFPAGDSSGEGFVGAATSHLITLAKAAPGFEVSPRRERLLSLGRAFILSIPWLLFVLGAAALVWGVAHFPPLVVRDAISMAARPTLPALAGFAAIVLALRGPLRLASGRIRNLIVGSFLVFPLAGLGGALIINGARDQSTTGIYSTDVVTKLELPLPGVPMCLVEVRSWRRDRERLRLYARGDSCRRVDSGRSVFVVTRSGRLGIEWLKEISTR